MGLNVLINDIILYRFMMFLHLVGGAWAKARNMRVHQEGGRCSLQTVESFELETLRDSVVLLATGFLLEQFR